MTKDNKEKTETVVPPVESEETKDDSTEQKLSEPTQPVETKEENRPLTPLEQARKNFELYQKQAAEQLRLMEALEQDSDITEFYNRIELLRQKRAELQELFSSINNDAAKLKEKYQNDPAVLQNILSSLNSVAPQSYRTRQSAEPNSERGVQNRGKTDKLPLAGEGQTKITMRFFELQDQGFAAIEAIKKISEELAASDDKYNKMLQEKGLYGFMYHVSRMMDNFEKCGLITTARHTSKNELVTYGAKRTDAWYDWLKTVQ